MNGSDKAPLIQFTRAGSDSAPEEPSVGRGGGANGAFANNALKPDEANLKELMLSSDNAENDSDDEEDEVFSQQRNFASKEARPLMAPRQGRASSTDSGTVTLRMPKPFKNRRKMSRCHLFVIFLGKCALVTAVAAILFVSTFFLLRATLKKVQTRTRHVAVTSLADHAACSHVSVEDVWVRPFPKLGIEGPLRLLDANQDGVLDIVVPFGSGVDSMEPITELCKVYYRDSSGPCAGGIMAVDGKSGDLIWREYLKHEPFALTCETDLTLDGHPDCVVSGRGGLMSAHDGKSGKILWQSRVRRGYLNYYTVQPVGDLDNDQVVDFAQVHGGDPRPRPEEKQRPKGELVLLSGATGRELLVRHVPQGKESYYSPQVLDLGDGLKAILFGTGGETIGGSLYLLRLKTLLANGTVKARSIFTSKNKGVMTPPAIVDINGDRVPDIVMAMFNGSVVAFDGVTFKRIWQTDFRHAESYSTPAPGYYNDDDVPDFLVQYSVGMGYPIYYYARYMILDGRDGKVILELPFSSTSVSNSPLTVSFDGRGHDTFLYWKKDCYGHEGEIKKEKFTFAFHQSVASHSEFCRVRFNTTYVTKLLMMGQHIKPPGILMYHSHRYFHKENEYNLDAWRREAYSYVKTEDSGELYREFKNFFDVISSVAKHKFSEQLEPLEPEYYSPAYGDASDDYHRWFGGNRRQRRHIGPHDGQGSTRLIATGTLAPSLAPRTNATSSIDVVFPIYVGAPSPDVTLMTPKEAKCFKELIDKESQRFDRKSPFYGYDTDRYKEFAGKYCAKHYGDPESQRRVKKGVTAFSKYFSLNYLQLTLYRKRITCHCNRSQPCLHILPFEKQRWTSYLGNHADSVMQNPI